MKKISKTIFAIILTVTLLLSTAVASFATDDGDPYGRCSAPIYITKTINIK